jgi:hypothetical protein
VPPAGALTGTGVFTRRAVRAGAFGRGICGPPGREISRAANGVRTENRVWFVLGAAWPGTCRRPAGRGYGGAARSDCRSTPMPQRIRPCSHADVSTILGALPLLPYAIDQLSHEFCLRRCQPPCRHRRHTFGWTMSQSPIVAGAAQSMAGTICAISPRMREVSNGWSHVQMREDTCHMPGLWR